MASALAQQLSALGRDDFRIGKASLLYDPRQAADIDLDAVYNLGLNGALGVRAGGPGRRISIS